MQQFKADSESRHSTDFRTIFGIMMRGRLRMVMAMMMIRKPMGKMTMVMMF